MSDLDSRLLDEFWERHRDHNPGRARDDFYVSWRNGYAFYYDVRDKDTDKSVMSIHADVVGNATPEAVAAEIAKAMEQIANGEAEEIDNIDGDLDIK